jgi:exocyst complex component 4
MASGNTETSEAHNPEADSYRYIEAVLEALFVLGKLTGALETVAQRVSTEIHHLIEATLDEVEERWVAHLSSITGYWLYRSEQRREEEAFGRPDELALATAAMTEKGARRQSVFTPSDTLRIAVSLDAMGPPRHAAILKDLFWTLYSKLAAVLEGHRVIYEVARWIPSVCPPSFCRSTKLIPSGKTSKTLLGRRVTRLLLYPYSKSGNPYSRKSGTFCTCTWRMIVKDPFSTVIRSCL